MASARPEAAAPSHHVKFVGHDAAGLPVKRKQVQQACNICRKRKKRCEHAPDSTHEQHESELSGTSEGTTHDDRDRDREPHPRRRSTALDRDASDAASQLLQFYQHVFDQPSHHTSQTKNSSPHNSSNKYSNSRSPDTQRRAEPDTAPPFIGDLNPQGILIEASMGDRMSGVAAHRENPHPGIWFEEDPPSRQRSEPPINDEDFQRLNETTDDESPPNDARGAFLSLPGKDGQRVVITADDLSRFSKYSRKALVAELASVVQPSDRAWQALRDIYLTRIHPLFPIFDGTTLVELRPHSFIGRLIQASVCLAAATAPEASKYLILNKIGKPAGHSQGQRYSTMVSYLEYSRSLVNFIQDGIQELRVQEPQEHVIEYIRITALTCLFWQPEPHARFAPLDLFAVLVTMVHSHGIHLVCVARVHDSGWGYVNGGVSRLFKCLYALDRLVATLSGRPVMFHNYDLLMTPESAEDDPPSFRLFMSLIMQLDRVIELYRPQPTVDHIDIPVFERLIIDTGAQGEPESILATLEVLYHAISVLSVRMPRDRFKASPEDDGLSGATYQHLPPSLLNARRSLSSDRIFEIARDCDLSPMPFVPYALALSLSVAYRKWRFSQTPMFRTRGKATFQKILPILRNMGRTWTSARINSNLGDTVLNNLSKAEWSVRNTIHTDNPGGLMSDTGRVQREALDGGRKHTKPKRRPVEETQSTISSGLDSRSRKNSRRDGEWPFRKVWDSWSFANANNELQTADHVVAEQRRMQQAQTLENIVDKELAAIEASIVAGAGGVAPVVLSQKPGQANSDLMASVPNGEMHGSPEAMSVGGSHSQTYSLSSPAVDSRATSLSHTNGGDTAATSHHEHNPGSPATQDLSDAALFLAWDPDLMDNVDWSFGSNLDPGWPLTWSEYSNGASGHDGAQGHGQY